MFNVSNRTRAEARLGALCLSLFVLESATQENQRMTVTTYRFRIQCNVVLEGCLCAGWYMVKFLPAFPRQVASLNSWKAFHPAHAISHME